MDVDGNGPVEEPTYDLLASGPSSFQVSFFDVVLIEHKAGGHLGSGRYILHCEVSCQEPEGYSGYPEG